MYYIDNQLVTLYNMDYVKQSPDNQAVMLKSSKKTEL